MSDAQLAKIKQGQFVLNVSDSGPKTAGFLILLIVVGLFGGWSAVAPLDSAALAPGSIVVEGYRKTVQHLEGGIVKTLNVRDGVDVKQGEVLLTLDDTLARSELGITQGQIIALRGTKARLIAERDQLDTIDFSSLAESSDPRALDAIKNETAVFDARNGANLGQIEVLNQRIQQLDEQLAGYDSLISSRVELTESYAQEIDELSELLKDGFVDIQRLRELERRAAELKATIADTRSAKAQAKVQRSEVELQIAQFRRELKTEVVNQLSQVETKLSDLYERERALKSRLDRTVITAPADGKVMAMRAHTIGGVIRGGEPILDIVPSNTKLVIEARVSPIDIDRVTLNMTAEVRFSAFKQAITPRVNGVVSSLSVDRLTDEATGLPYYLATIELPRSEIEKLGELTLVAGMPAEVLITTGERTLLEYLIQPATDAVARSMIED